jgi:membrane protease YdiL (CAAX protease family)
MNLVTELHEAKESILSQQFLLLIVFSFGILFNLGLLIGGLITPVDLKDYYYLHGLPAIFILVSVTAARQTQTRGAFKVLSLNSSKDVAQSVLALAIVILGLRLLWWLYLRAFMPDLLPVVAPLSFHWKWKGWGHAAVRSLICSPISEEILFRGWLLKWLGDRDAGTIGVGRFLITRANLVCSIAFTLAHLTATGPLYGLRLFGVFCGSLAFGISREKTGGLAVPIMLHAVANLFGEYL